MAPSRRNLIASLAIVVGCGTPEASAPPARTKQVVASSSPNVTARPADARPAPAAPVDAAPASSPSKPPIPSAIQPIQNKKQLLGPGALAKSTKQPGFRRATTIIFGYGWGRWIPLYCYDRTHKSFAVGDRCLAGKRGRLTLGLVGGGTTTTRRRGKAVACGYTPSPSSTRALVPRKQVEPTDSPSKRLAVWPSKHAPRLARTLPPHTPSAVERAAVAAYLKQQAVLEAFRLDATDDGVADVLFTVASSRNRRPGLQSIWPSSMIVLIGPDFSSAREVFSSVSNGQQAISASDLDGNGTPEAVFHEAPVNEGYFVAVVEGMVYSFGCAFL